MKKMYYTLVAAVALSCSANAAITTYNFNNLSNGSLGHSETFSVNGTEITAYAFTYYSGLSEWRESDIFVQNGALGVRNSLLDNNQIDNFVRYDLLAFDLSPAEAERVRLSSVNSNDEWTIGWNNDLISPPNDSPYNFYSNSLDGYTTGDRNDLSNRWYDFGGATGQTIYVSAGDFFGFTNDDIRVTALTIDTPPVPEPSTYALFGLGMFSLFLARRKVRS